MGIRTSIPSPIAAAYREPFRIARMAYLHGFAGRKPVLAVISLALPPRGVKDDVSPAERKEVMVKKLVHGHQGNPSAYRR